jgi:hypothetical protein
MQRCLVGGPWDNHMRSYIYAATQLRDIAVKYQHDRKNKCINDAAYGDLSTASQIAALGYCLTAEGKPLVGKYAPHNYKPFVIKDRLNDFNKFSRKANCLGDLLILANVQGMLHYAQTKLEKTHDQDEYNEYIKKAEIMLAVLAIYRSDLAFDYIRSQNFLYPELSGMLTGIDPDGDQIDYDLPAEVQLYYRSAGNLYIREDGKTVNVKSHHSMADPVDASYIVDDLAAVVGMITSDNVDQVAVDAYIGLIRNYIVF